MITKMCKLCDGRYPINETICQECDYDENCPCCILREDIPKKEYFDSLT